VVAPDGLDQGQSVHARHLKIGDDQVGPSHPHRSQGGESISSRFGFKTRVFEKIANLGGLRGTIFDNEHSRHLLASLWCVAAILLGRALSRKRRPCRPSIWNIGYSHGIGQRFGVAPIDQAERWHHVH
jgi:hypothetical protein